MPKIHAGSWRALATALQQHTLWRWKDSECYMGSLRCVTQCVALLDKGGSDGAWLLTVGRQGRLEREDDANTNGPRGGVRDNHD